MLDLIDLKYLYFLSGDGGNKVGQQGWSARLETKVG